MRIIVIGSGRVGAGVAHNLALRRHDVAVIDRVPDAFDRLGPGFAGTRVQGSGLDRPVLVRAGIERADALAVVTGRDDVNAVVAHAARVVFDVPTVVARLYDPRNAVIHQRLGIRTIAPVTWGIRRIADLLTTSHVEPIAALGTGKVEIVDVHVPHLLASHAVGELEVPGETRVVAVTRDGDTFLVDPATPLAAGDVAHVAVTGSSAGRLETLIDHL